MRLFPCDRDHVLRILPELYAYARPTRFLETSLHVLSKFIESDHLGWTVFEFRDALRLVTAVTSDRPFTPRMIKVFEEAAPSHPYISHFQTARAPTAVMLSDMPKQRRIEHRGQYEESYRLLEMNHGLTLPVVFGSHSIVALSFTRRAYDFTERDRSLLNVLLPHLQRAYANAQLVERGEDPNQVRRACEEGFGLTGREAEIAFWTAQGKTNGEIAVILSMAKRTVEKHVEHLLAKLGVENRATAAVQIHDWSRTQLPSVPAVESVRWSGRRCTRSESLLHDSRRAKGVLRRH
jgi:DNA-binding CsgD family transcriptional regulator